MQGFCLHFIIFLFQILLSLKNYFAEVADLFLIIFYTAKKMLRVFAIFKMQCVGSLRKQYCRSAGLCGPSRAMSVSGGSQVQ